MSRAGADVLWIYHSAVVDNWRRGRVDALRSEGCEVEVVSSRRWNEGGEVVELRPAAGEHVMCAPTAGHHPFLFAYHPWQLWKALRRTHPDVIDLHEEPASLAAFEVLVLARLAGSKAPVVCYSAQNLSKDYPPPFRWIEQWVFGQIAAIHSCNDRVTEVLRAKGFAGEVLNLGLGIDLADFSPSDDGGKPEAGRGAPLRVGFVGRLETRKGIFVLLNAVAGLADSTLTFVGAGEDRSHLEAAIEGRNLGDRVSIRGFADQRDLPNLYRSFDVVVVPSLDTPSWCEQFGRVVVEAMASGVPVVVSDSGALPEVAADAGLVVPQRDARALAEALASLRDDPELRRDLRARGLVRATHFSWKSIAERQSDLYRRVRSGEVVGDNRANRGSAA